jgi:hypothetical protein
MHQLSIAMAPVSRRLVMLRLGELFAFRLGSDHVADLSQRLNARRQEIAIILDDRGKLPFGESGLFVG